METRFKRNGAKNIREMAEEFKAQYPQWWENERIGTIITHLIGFKKLNLMVVTDDEVILYF